MPAYGLPGELAHGLVRFGMPWRDLTSSVYTTAYESTVSATNSCRAVFATSLTTLVCLGRAILLYRLALPSPPLRGGTGGSEHRLPEGVVDCDRRDECHPDEHLLQELRCIGDDEPVTQHADEEEAGDNPRDATDSAREGHAAEKHDGERVDLEALP